MEGLISLGKEGREGGGMMVEICGCEAESLVGDGGEGWR